MRVAVLSNSATPNNDALFAAVAAEAGVELQVLYCVERESRRAWHLAANKEYPRAVLPGISLGSSHHLNPTVGRTLSEFRPDVAVLSGSYTMPTFHLAWRALERGRCPWVYWGEPLDWSTRARPMELARRLLRSPLSRGAGVLAIGRRAAESYLRLGIPADRIANFHYYADVERFQLRHGEWVSAREVTRRKLGWGDSELVVLYCGDLIGRKDVRTLVEAVASAARTLPELRLMIVGRGPEQDELRRLAEARSIADSVAWLGFVQPAELPGVFAAADCLALPSRQEGWGVVVSEALAAGLPVLASTAVNAGAELVAPNETGFFFEVGDHDTLAEHLRHLAGSPGTFQYMKDAARRAGESESPRHAAPRLLSLLEMTRKGERWPLDLRAGP